MAKLGRPRWTWDAQKELAAARVAAGRMRPGAGDRLTNAAIAKEIGVSRATIQNWIRDPDFNARVEQHVAAFRLEIADLEIFDQTARLQTQNEDWKRVKSVRAARAEYWIRRREQLMRLRADVDAGVGMPDAAKEAKLAEIDGDPCWHPGMETGQIVVVPRQVGDKVVNFFEWDTDYLAERLKLEQSVARETGQMAPARKDITSGGAAIKAYVGFDVEEV